MELFVGTFLFPVEGTGGSIPLMLHGEIQDMFSGVYSHKGDPFGDGSDGKMQTKFGISRITSWQLGRDVLRFTTVDINTDEVGYYAFAKKKDGSWHGNWVTKYKGRIVGRGHASILSVVETSGDSFSRPAA